MASDSGRFDIHAQLTTMSRIRSAQRKGHLERLQRIYGYVLKTKHYLTRYRTEEPDCTLQLRPTLSYTLIKIKSEKSVHPKYNLLTVSWTYLGCKNF